MTNLKMKRKILSESNEDMMVLIILLLETEISYLLSRVIKKSFGRQSDNYSYLCLV